MKRTMRIPLGLVLLCSGCFVDAPGESGSEAPSTTDTAAATTSTTSTTSGSSSLSTSNGGVSTTGSTSTTSPTSTSSSSSSTTQGGGPTSATTTSSTGTSSSSTTGDGSTTSDLPNPLVIPGALTACVLLESGPYEQLGPDACSEAATAQNGTDAVGVLSLDTQALYAMGRESRIYLRFPLPPALDGVTILNTELSVVIADGENAGGPIGNLFRVANFNSSSLDTDVPTNLELIDKDPGLDVMQNTEVIRTIPSKIVVDSLELSNLYLGLIPTDPDGTLIHGKKSGPGLQPTLRITYE